MKSYIFLTIGLLFCCLTLSCREELVKAESAKANAFFDSTYDAMVDRSPEYQTFLGIKKDYDKWNDISDENNHKELDITKAELEELEDTINYDLLDAQTKISYDLFVLSQPCEHVQGKCNTADCFSVKYTIDITIPTSILSAQAETS